MGTKTKVIIDTDPGIDDALALFMAFGCPDIEVEALTVAQGNVSLDRTEKNARKICEFLWKPDVPVYAGKPRSLARGQLVNAAWVHGEDGLGGLDFPEASFPLQKKDASDFLVEKIMKTHDREITLICLAPLTNVATAFLKEPKIIRQVKEIIVMGGCFSESGLRGNTTPFAEFNVYADPHATKIVMEHGERLTVIPMEVGNDARASEKHFEALKKMDNRAGKMALRLIEEVTARCNARLAQKGLPLDTCASLYDPCAVACLLKPALFSGKYGTIDVETDSKNEKFGMTSFVEGNKRNVHLITRMDHDAFFNLFLENIARLS